VSLRDTFDRMVRDRVADHFGTAAWRGLAVLALLLLLVGVAFVVVSYLPGHRS
jgi:hypothetical protein